MLKWRGTWRNNPLVVLMLMVAATAFSFLPSPMAVRAEASGLRIEAAVCDLAQDRVSVTFRWDAAAPGDQWLDLSLFDNGFAQGTFLGSGPWPSTTTAIRWDGILPGKVHVTRVNTWTGANWEPSSTIRFLTPVCNGPATSLSIANAFCSPALAGRVTVTVAWLPGQAGDQWVDLSLFNNGFQPWTFLNNGPLAAGTGSLVWDGLIEDRLHYLRVNTFTGSGWKPSQTMQVRTPRCSTSGIRPIVTLTFDDGGAYAHQVLDVLDAKAVRAIFFPYGSWAEANRAVVTRMIGSGHLVGNHTYSHVNLTLLAPDQIRAEIARGDIGNANLFRPVYGIINAQVQAIVEEMGFTVYKWTIDPRDWEKTYVGGDQDIVHEVLSQAKPGAVVLLHMQTENTLRALPAIIDGLRSAGYELAVKEVAR